MLIAAVNIIIIIIVGIGIYVSILLLRQLNRGSNTPLGWWAFLPAVLSYAFILRALQLLIYIRIVDDPKEITPAFYILFYSGLVIFVYGLYSVTCRLLMTELHRE